jgi:hypothetical protein
VLFSLGVSARNKVLGDVVDAKTNERHGEVMPCQALTFSMIATIFLANMIHLARSAHETVSFSKSLPEFEDSTGVLHYSGIHPSVVLP